jgi:hypothetical protein
VAKEKDEGAERNPKPKEESANGGGEKAELSRDYKDARDELPDDPRDDPHGLRIPTEAPQTPTDS